MAAYLAVFKETIKNRHSIVHVLHGALPVHLDGMPAGGLGSVYVDQSEDEVPCGWVQKMQGDSHHWVEATGQLPTVQAIRGALVYPSARIRHEQGVAVPAEKAQSW